MERLTTEQRLQIEERSVKRVFSTLRATYCRKSEQPKKYSHNIVAVAESASNDREP